MIKKMEDIGSLPLLQKVNIYQRISEGLKKLVSFGQRNGVLLMVISFLLGRGVMIGELSPFAVPFIAVMYHLRRDKVVLISFAALVGALTHQAGQPTGIFIGLILFLLFQKCLDKWGKGALTYTPFSVFGAVFIANTTIALFTNWTSYQLLMATVEAGLALVLTFIFVQSVPLLTAAKRTQPLRNEELVCLVILLASLMTGMVGWLFFGLSLEHIFSRYAILLFAFAAGGAIGATVGVVTGIILSLANLNALPEVSLLAFSGLLGGLLKEGKKIGVASGLLIGTLVMGLYTGTEGLWLTLQESLVAIIFFFLTPKQVFQKISSYIPGTMEHSFVQQDYAKRIRDVTAQKVQQFSQVFSQLSSSFANSQQLAEEERARQTDLFLSKVTETTCQACFKKEQCWERKFDDTYQLMDQMVNLLHVSGEIKNQQIVLDWSKHCVKSQKVIDVMEEEFVLIRSQYLYKQKMSESRRIVAEQLSGVSQVMNDFAREIQRDGENHQVQEQQILDAFEELGLEVRYVDIISLEEGNVHVEISQPFCHGRDECAKIVAPLLSEIMGETIAVEKKACDFYHDGYCKMTLKTAKSYKVEIGMASAAKGGGWVSGDHIHTMPIGNGKYAVALSDGMGNGSRANQESVETLTLLEQILQSGIEETVAIKSINSVLSLRSTDEVFSTLDLAMIDLQTAKTKFIKIGSTPSFIKRGDEVLAISANNLPMGILQEIDVDIVSEQLKPGDLLIMMTDGIYDGPRHIENKELWLKRLLTEIITEDPQEVADLLLEKVVRSQQGHIFDDMSVVVTKVEKNLPEWSTISLKHMPKVRKQSRLLS